MDVVIDIWDVSGVTNFFREEGEIFIDMVIDILDGQRVVCLLFCCLSFFSFFSFFLSFFLSICLSVCVNFFVSFFHSLSFILPYFLKNMKKTSAQIPNTQIPIFFFLKF